MGWEAEKEEIVQAARHLLSKGLVAATSGNVSICLEDADGSKLLAITPTSMRYEEMKPEDIVVIDFEGDVVEGYANPSSESLIHIAVYKARPDIKCVIHTHSVYASILAVTGLELPPILDELVTYLGGAVQVADYGFPSTEDLGNKACAALGDRNAVFLRNHGVIAAGKTMGDALRACELVEISDAVSLLMRHAGLGSIPNPVAADTAPCTTGTRDMSAFPDTASGAGTADKLMDPFGRAYEGDDRDGYVLVGHDVVANNQQTDFLQSYVRFTGAIWCYTADPDGRVHQYDEAGELLGARTAPRS